MTQIRKEQERNGEREAELIRICTWTHTWCVCLGRVEHHRFAVDHFFHSFVRVFFFFVSPFDGMFVRVIVCWSQEAPVVVSRFVSAVTSTHILSLFVWLFIHRNSLLVYFVAIIFLFSFSFHCCLFNLFSSLKVRNKVCEIINFCVTQTWIIPCFDYIFFVSIKGTEKDKNHFSFFAPIHLRFNLVHRRRWHRDVKTVRSISKIRK